MIIKIMVEGKTESAFMPFLKEFLKTRLEAMPALKPVVYPALKPVVYKGGVPTGNELKRDVANLLSGKKPADHVIWLTDVYVDKQNPGKGLWQTAQQAKSYATRCVDPKYHAHFHPHVALHDFEAWLLPYWDRIKKHAKSNRNAPSGAPETVNHQKSPAYHVNDAYMTGAEKRRYSKTKDPQAILRGQDLTKAIEACPELKAFVNTILRLSAGDKMQIP